MRYGRTGRTIFEATNSLVVVAVVEVFVAAAKEFVVANDESSPTLSPFKVRVDEVAGAVATVCFINFVDVVVDVFSRKKPSVAAATLGGRRVFVGKATSLRWRVARSKRRWRSREISTRLFFRRGAD